MTILVLTLVMWVCNTLLLNFGYVVCSSNLQADQPIVEYNKVRNYLKDLLNMSKKKIYSKSFIVLFQLLSVKNFSPVKKTNS
jgi:hypothetical protein